MSRAERARRIAAYVAAQVWEAAPPGLGYWAPAWELVEEPSRAFLEALAAWEETDSPENRAAVQKAAAAVVEAWQLAAAEWERAGRPVTPRESAEVDHAAH